MASYPDSLISPDGYYLALEADEARLGAVRFRKDFVEDVAVLQPSMSGAWELDFETAYYYPSVTVAGRSDCPPVEAALVYIDLAIAEV